MGGGSVRARNNGRTSDISEQHSHLSDKYMSGRTNCPAKNFFYRACGYLSAEVSSMRYETFLLAIVMSEYGTQNNWPGSSNGSFRLASFLLLFPFEIVGVFWFVSLWRAGALAMELGSITSTAVGVEFRVPAASVPETHASDTGSFSLHHVKKRPLPDKIELRTLSLSFNHHGCLRSLH